MNYCGLDTCDVLNGIGFRVSLFCSGCNKIPKCMYCQNSKAWDFNYGKPFTDETKNIILNALSKPYISGLSLLGGEVTDNLSDGIIFDLLDNVKSLYPNKTIWSWTGYNIENLTSNLHKKFLSYIDVLIDGEFRYDEKNLNRAWANSNNQRIIDVKKTLAENKVVLWEKQ